MLQLLYNTTKIFVQMSSTVRHKTTSDQLKRNPNYGKIPKGFLDLLSTVSEWLHAPIFMA